MKSGLRSKDFFKLTVRFLLFKFSEISVCKNNSITLLLQSFLSHSIKVVQQILILSVEVRILVGQLKLLMVISL